MGACTSTIAMEDAGAELTGPPCDAAAPCKQLQLTTTPGAETAGAAFSHGPKRRSRNGSRSHASGVTPVDSIEYNAAAAVGTAAALDAAICTAVAAVQSAVSARSTRAVTAAEPLEPASPTSQRRVPLSAVSTSGEVESGIMSLHSARQGRHSCNPSAQLLPLDEPTPASLQPPTQAHSTKLPPPPAVATAASSILPKVSTPAMAAWGVRGSDSRPSSAASRPPPAPLSRPSSARAKPFGRGAAGVADVADTAGFSMQEPHIVVAAELPSLTSSVPAAAVSEPAPPTSDCLQLVRRMNFAKLPPLMAQQEANYSLATAVSGGVTARSARKSAIPLSSLPVSVALAPRREASPSPPLIGCSVFVDASCQVIPSTRSSRSGSTKPLMIIVSIDCRTPPDGEPADGAPARPAPLSSNTAAEAQTVTSAPLSLADDSVEEVKLIRRARGGAKWRKQVEHVKQKQLEDELAVVAVQQHAIHVEQKEETAPKSRAPVATFASAAPVSALSSASSIQIVAPQPVRPAVLVLKSARAAGAAAPQRPGTPNPVTALLNPAPPAPLQQAKPAKTIAAPLGQGLPPRPEQQSSRPRESKPARVAHAQPPPAQTLPQWVLQPFLQHPRTIPCPFPSRVASPPGRSLLDFQEGRDQINRDHEAAMGAKTHTVLQLLRAGMLSPRVSARLVRAGSLQPLHTSRTGTSWHHAAPYVFDPSGDSMPRFDLASEAAGPAPVQHVPAARVEAREARPLSAMQKLKMEQRAAGSSAPPVVRKLPLRPRIPPLNLELLGLPRCRPDTTRALPPSPHGRLFPLTPRDGSVAGEDEFEPGSQRVASSPSPRAPVAEPSRHTLDGALNTSRRAASSRSGVAAPKKPAPVLPRTLPAPVPLAAPKPAATAAAPLMAAAAQGVAGAAPAVVPARAPLPAPGHFAQDLSKDGATIRAFCNKLSAAAAQGGGGIAHLTLFQTAPAAPVNVVEHHVWRILDAIIAGAAARAPGSHDGRVLDVLDMTDVTGEGMVRSIMRRMCQTDSENEQEQKQQQQQPLQVRSSQAQPSNGGLLRLKQLMLRLDFPAMAEPRFSSARNIYTLCLRALSSTSLTRLNLYRSNLGEKGVSTIIAAAARNPNLQTLELVSCGVGPLGGQLLVLLAEHPSLTAVDLALNCLGDAEVITACAALSNPRSKLRSLGLGLNEFGVDGIRAISRAISSRASRAGVGAGGLRALNIEGTNLQGRVGAAEVALMLSAGSALERLDVSYCNLGVEGVKIVCDAVARNGTMRELNIAGNMGADLSRAAINSSAAAVAAAQIGAMRSLELLAQNQTLRALDLRDNHLLARPCAIAQSLQSLAAAHPTLESMLLSGNGLAREQTAAIQMQLATRKERRLQQRQPIAHPAPSNPVAVAQAVPAQQAAARPPSASSHGKALVTPLNFAASSNQPRVVAASVPARQPLASVPLQQQQQQMQPKQNALTVAAAKLTARASARTTLVSNLGAPRISARMPLPPQPQQAQPQQRARNHPPGGMQVFYAALDGGKPAPAGGRPISAKPVRSSAVQPGAALTLAPFGAGHSMPRSFESPAPRLPSARGDLTLFGVGPPQACRVSQSSLSHLVDSNHISSSMRTQRP